MRPVAAGEPAGLLGGDAEHRHRPLDLGLGPLERLAVLGGDHFGDLFGAGGEHPGHVLERAGADVRGGAAQLLRDRHRGGDRAFDLLRPGHGDRGDLAAVVRVVHDEGGGARLRAAGDPGGARLGGDHVHAYQRNPGEESGVGPPPGRVTA
jgi:hypothetical protein